jgi:hypothetical protein
MQFLFRCAGFAKAQSERERARTRGETEDREGEGELDEKERAGSCDLSTLWPLAHRTWGGRGPQC